MLTATNRTKAQTGQKNSERVNVLAQFVDRFSEARTKSQYLTFPFAY
ncbi:MAG: hypothetical protein WAM74_10455 [Xanthobacteraceae bacterium]